MEPGRSKNGQVILSGGNCAASQKWGKAFVASSGVAKHFLQGGVIERTVDGGVGHVAGRAEWGLDQCGGWEGAPGGGGGGTRGIARGGGVLLLGGSEVGQCGP